MNVKTPSQGLNVPGLRSRPGTESSVAPAPSRSLQAMGHNLRLNIVSFIGEFVGTCMFLFFALSATQVANTKTLNMDPLSSLLYISLAFGMSLMVTAWTFYRVTGGLFNPAVTVALCLIGAVPWLRGAIVFAAQLLGGMAAAGIVSALFPGSMTVETTLSPGVSITRGLFVEAFCTAQLVFTIIMLATEKHRSTPVAPVGIGFALFISQLSAVHFTGGSLNPARSFGPAVINGSFPGYHWIYWLGPLLGALLAVGFFKLIKFLEYEVGNPNAEDVTSKQAQPVRDESYDGAVDGADSASIEQSLGPRVSVTSCV